MCDDIPEACSKCKSWVTDGCDAWYCEKGFSVGGCNKIISKKVRMNILNYAVALLYIIGFIIVYGGVRKAMDFGLDWKNISTIIFGVCFGYAAFFYHGVRSKEIEALYESEENFKK